MNKVSGDDDEHGSYCDDEYDGFSIVMIIVPPVTSE